MGPARPQTVPRVLGIDPGLTETGYGLIGLVAGGGAVLATGVITTHPELPLAARLVTLYDGVDALLASHAPELLVLEDLYSEYRFPRTALLMAHARGVVCLAAQQRKVEILPIAPAEVKRAVTGSGAASKPQIQHAVRRLLALDAVPRSSHVADALALAFTGFSRAGGLWR